MIFEFKAIEGPYEGQKFQVREGTEFGRVRGQVLLKKDSKVSSFHAMVIQDPGGALVLVDQGSSNGIKVNGRRFKRIVLTDGLILQIGRSIFTLTAVSDEAAENLPPPKTWKENLVDEIQKLEKRILIPKVSLRNFQRKVELHFVEGIQSDETFELGFGPREFGSDCLDFELREAISPPIAFSITPDGAGAVFTTDFPKLVMINNESESSKDLIDGDLIRIGQSLIRVEIK